MKRLVEDFDDMMKVEDEVSVEDTKSPLEKELIRVYEYLKDKGETDIKEYETAYQEAIEKIYPENLWWEVIDLNIFWDLFENQNPRITIDNIISSVKPEFKKEVIDTVVTEDVEEENPLKDIRGNIMEFPNGEYVYVEYADGKLYAGSATNTGIIHEHEMDYDKDFDVDKNLQDFFDKIIEENPELGEPLDESKKVCEDTVKQGNKWVNKGKDGTHGTFKTKKAADAQRRAMFANKGKKSTFGEGRKTRPIKESDSDFVVFEQEPDDVQIDTDWFFDDDGIEYYIDGGYDFADINKDFLDKKVDNEAIHKAFDDIDEGDEFYTVEDVFDYFDDGDIVDALSAGLGEPYKSVALNGYTQSEAATIYYPERSYSRDDINIIEDYYFGKVIGWYNDEYGEVVLTDTEIGLGYDDSAKIKGLISGATGVPVDEIKLRRFKGYRRVADYIDESKQRRGRNHRVTEAKQKRLSRKQRVKRIYERVKRKPKKNLKEATDDEIKLFMNTWANYNENGADGVITPTGWMSLDEAEEYADKYEEYEPFINDTDNVPEELGVNEYSGISGTIDMLRKYEDFDDTQKEVFATFIDYGYDVDEAFSIVDDRDYIYYEADSDADLAYNYTDEIGGVESLGRDTLEQYFDYDAFGRDLAYDFIKTEYGYVSH